MHLCHQALWPQLDVQFVSVTDQWAQFAVAGPRSRDLLQRVLDPACDISNAAFPFMACGEVRLRTARPPACSASRSRANSPTRSPCRPPRRCPDPHAARGRPGPRRHALRTRGAQRAAHRERPRDRQRTQRPDDRLRPGLRPHGLDEKDYIGAVMAGASTCSIRRGRGSSASSPWTAGEALGWHALRAAGAGAAANTTRAT